MKIRTLIGLLFFSTRAVAQFNSPPPIEWQRCYGGTQDDIGYAVSATSDGGYIMSGCTGSIDGDIALKIDETLHGSKCDYWYAKTDASGTILFAHNPGGTGSDVARSAVQTPDGGYIIAGGAESNDVDVFGNHGEFDFWVIKLNPAGDIVWSKCYGGTTFEDYGSMTLTSDGGMVFTGGAHSTNGDVTGNHGSSDFWLVKTDGSGNLLWAQCYGGSGYEKAFDVKETVDGGFILAGFTESNDGQVTGNHSADYDGWVMKADASGNFLWGKCFGGTLQDGFYRIAILWDSTILLSGYTYSMDGDLSANNGVDDAWLVRLDAEGNKIWSKNFGGDNSEAFQTIRQDAGGYVIACGYTRSFNEDLDTNYGQWDYWLLRFETDGSIQWDTVYGGDLSEVCYDFDLASDGGLIGNGYTESNSGDVSSNHGKKDFWVIRLANVVSVQEVFDSEMKIYPTLADHWISVSGLNRHGSEPWFEIIAMDGRICHRALLPSDNRIQVSDLPHGVYLLAISGEQARMVSRFVKK